MAAEKIVAFDLGAQQVSAAVFTTGAKDQLILNQFESSELLADPAADATRLEQTKGAIGALAKDLKLKKIPVRYSVSSQSVFTRFVKLPPLDTDKLDQIVGFEAQQQVPFPLEDAVWDYQTLGRPDDIEVEVVITAIKSDELDLINSALRDNGLETKVVDLAPLALYNAFRYNYPDVEGSVVLIDIGARTTNLIYCEGPKLFVRNINVGGRDITNAIAKEFDTSFLEAEERKIQDGFVALGGGYADHEDPEIAAMSKVIRQASTRLHSEIVRTNNFYRSNQGGAAPQMAFLCGAGAGLPYLNEFLQEKLKINVDYFNALRNVQVGKQVDEAVVARHAHSLGELVGLGLRAFPNCPMELNLEPRIVARENAIVNRAPALWLAGFSAAAMIGAAGFFFQNAVGFAEDKSVGLLFDIAEPVDPKLQDSPAKRNAQRAAQLTAHPETGEKSKQWHVYDEQITAELETLAEIEKRSEPYSNAVLDRIYWVTTFEELAARMEDDRIWFTEIQPMAGGKTVLEPIVRQDDKVGILGKEDALAETIASGNHIVDSLQLKGLWRDVEGSSADVVYQYLERLRESIYFDLAVRDENGQIKREPDGKIVAPDHATSGKVLPYINQGTSGDRHAWDFTMVLPLPSANPNRQIPFTKQAN